jgi:transposase-like protein
LVYRARIIRLAGQGKTIPQISAELGCAPNVVRRWFKRFDAQGLAGLEDAPRSGAPPHFTADDRARVGEVARTQPTELGVPSRRLGTSTRLGATPTRPRVVLPRAAMVSGAGPSGLWAWLDGWHPEPDRTAPPEQTSARTDLRAGSSEPAKRHETHLRLRMESLGSPQPSRGNVSGT